MSTQSSTFELPQMSDGQTQEDDAWQKLADVDYESMKGEEAYQSPENATQEALDKIKAMKFRQGGQALLGLSEIMSR